MQLDRPLNRWKTGFSSPATARMRSRRALTTRRESSSGSRTTSPTPTSTATASCAGARSARRRRRRQAAQGTPRPRPGRRTPHCAAYANDPRVEYAEPNWIVTTRRPPTTRTTPTARSGACTATPPRPANQYGSQAGEAWAAGHTGSTSVYVGDHRRGHRVQPPRPRRQHLDQPVRPRRRRRQRRQRLRRRHPRLGLLRQQQQRSTTAAPARATSLDDHGTHVAGTIGGEGGNGIGVAGVNWNVTLHLRQVPRPDGGTRRRDQGASTTSPT